MQVALEAGSTFVIPLASHYEEDLDEAKTAQILHDHVDDLPPQQRRVIHSVFFDGLTPAETARRLGITGAAVSKLKAKALKRLLDGLAPRRGQLLF